MAPVGFVWPAGVAQQHHDPLLGLDELRMAQLALALEAIEAVPQRVYEVGERLGQHGAALDFPPGHWIGGDGNRPGCSGHSCQT